MKVFVSDLHLGCGDERDDFLFLGADATEESLKKKAFRQQAFSRMHRLFEKFILSLLRLTKSLNTQPELVLLGDIFDLLQVEPVEAEFRKPSRLQRIFSAHKPFFDALNHFTRNGGSLTFVVGNHDHELVDKKLFARLIELLPQLNKNYDGKPLQAYVNEEWRIYAEHGNQLDPLNRFKDFSDPEELPLGSIVVVKLVNPFEPLYPLFDNIQGTYETLWYAAYRLPELLAPELRQQIKEHQRDSNGITASLINHLLYILIGKGVLKIDSRYLPLIKEAIVAGERLIKKFAKKRASHWQNELRLLTEASQSNLLGQAEKILTQPKKANLLTKIPHKLNFLLLGHTHQPLTLRTEHGIYANCGCWRPRAVALYRRIFRLRQTLNFVVITRTSSGDLRLQLRDFLKEIKAGAIRN